MRAGVLAYGLIEHNAEHYRPRAAGIKAKKRIQYRSLKPAFQIRSHSLLSFAPSRAGERDRLNVLKNQ